MDKSDPSFEQHVLALTEAVRLRLQAIREEKDLSFYRLSKLSGLDERGIAYIERGENMPTIDSIARLALALDVKVSDLLREAEDSMSGEVKK